ncbi:MAG: DUF1850 domain-containing protein [Thermodesulfobacteriota bacterium]
MKQTYLRMILGIGLCVGILLFFPFLSVLHVVSFPAKTSLGHIRVAHGDTFTLGFIHSVNRRPVLDTIRIAEQGLVIESSRFDAFGAGMPETTNAEGRLQTLPDGTLLWTVHRPVPEITIRIGWTADHTLCIHGRTIRLADLLEPGKALTLRLESISVYQFLKGKRL